MYLCYIDESGGSSLNDNTSHFVLAGLCIPIWKWKYCENQISKIKRNYDLENAEIHSGWILRSYHEQQNIPDFDSHSRHQRKIEVRQYRRNRLLEIQRTNNSKKYNQVKKNYKNTEPYIHLTIEERRQFMAEIAITIGSWSFARLFAECIDKVFYDPEIAPQTIDEQAFEQVVSRFEKYLQIRPKYSSKRKNYGLLIHDNNFNIEKKHTEMMKGFHKHGTLWTRIDNIIETPLFVSSELTSLIQIADVCGYALRKYVEKSDESLFDPIFQRADRRGNKTVGIRHYTNSDCSCKICERHINSGH